MLKIILLFFGLPVVLLACSRSESTPTSTATQIALPTPTVTLTPLPPTPTPVPLAAKVNGEGITLEEFQGELLRYQAAQGEAGENHEGDARIPVLNDLVDQVLLAQGAREAGFVLTEEDLQAHLEQLENSAGGEAEQKKWLEDNSYSVESFQKALARSIAAAWMRDQIIASLPQTVEQVHARQILLYNSDQADEVLAELNAGRDFADLAAAYDSTTQGDLGWFPRGYLTDSKLEEVAFNLHPDQYSEVVETRVGYHILQVIERDPARLLDPDARLVLQGQALQSWLEARRNQSEILSLLPP